MALRSIGAILAILTVSQLWCGAQPPMATEPFKTYKLDLARPVGPDETVRARVDVGHLRRGDSIVVRTAAGEMAGTISPFGATKPGQKIGTFVIPIPPKAVSGQRVVLTLEVVGGARSTAARRPTAVGGHHPHRFRGRRSCDGLRLPSVPITRGYAGCGHSGRGPAP